MLDGVLAGPDGRCGRKSRSVSGRPSTGETLSRAAPAPTLEPRGRRPDVLAQAGKPVACEGGGDEAIVVAGGACSKISGKVELALIAYGCCRSSSDDPELSES